MWKDVGSEFEDRVVFMDILGLENSGKTTLALSAPGPIALIHGGEKINGIAQRLVKKGKKIREHRYGFIPSGNTAADKAKAAPMWKGVRAAYFDAMDKWARGVVFDTGNNLWETVRLAHTGQINPKGNRMDALYGPINADIRGLLQGKFRNENPRKCNVVTIHHMGDQYVDRLKDGVMQSVRTGKTERKGGFKEVKFIADVIVECYRGPSLEFLATIRKGWFNASVEGIELSDEVMQESFGLSGLNFASIMAFITERPESEWNK